MRLLGKPGAPVSQRRARRACAFFVATFVVAGAALLGATGAAAGPAVSSTTPLTYDGMNTCTGEAFSGTGNLHMVMSDNLSTSGVIEYHLETKIDGLKAFTMTGKKYVVQDTYDHEFVIGPATEETLDITAHFIRVGEDGSFVLGDDFYEYFRTHITANANGVVTASFARMNDMPCQ
jgi:hypothetical protein